VEPSKNINLVRINHAYSGGSTGRQHSTTQHRAGHSKGIALQPRQSRMPSSHASGNSMRFRQLAGVHVCMHVLLLQQEV
jgi:hypothetical protein